MHLTKTLFLGKTVCNLRTKAGKFKNMQILAYIEQCIKSAKMNKYRDYIGRKIIIYFIYKLHRVYVKYVCIIYTYTFAYIHIYAYISFYI